MQSQSLIYFKINNNSLNLEKDDNILYNFKYIFKIFK